MSKLDLIGRPYVVFDPQNVDHRRWYAQFAKTGSWGACPVRFVVDGAGLSNGVALMSRMIVTYYATKEFGTESA